MPERLKTDTGVRRSAAQVLRPLEAGNVNFKKTYGGLP
jgi:hypothetical protein